MPDRLADDASHGFRARIGRMMRRRLLAILLLIGAAAVAGYVTFLLVIVGGAELGGLINDAGRQRMLVHRVALDAVQMHEALADREVLRRDILGALDMMDESLDEVQTALADAGPRASDAVAALRALRPHYALMRSDAVAVVRAADGVADPAVVAASYRIVAIARGRLTQGIDDLVTALEGMSRQRYADIRLYSVTATVAFVLFLAALGWRALWPLSREVEAVVSHLSHLEDMQRTLVDRLPDGILVLDGRGGRIIQMNEEAERLFGWTLEDEPRLADLLPDANLDQLARTCGRIRGHARDGRTYHVEVIARRVGERWLLHIQDVTAEVEAKASLAAFYEVLESLPACIAITDADGRIEFVNARFCDMTGYGPDEAKGLKPAILKSGETAEAVYRDLWTTLLSGRQWRGEILNRRKNGDLYWQYEVITPLRDSHGRLSRFFVIAEDVTPLKETEEKLRTALANAEEGNRIKSSFLAGMSHELRTPLNAIIGYSELMQMGVHGDLAPGYGEYVENILFSGRHLLELINDLLDLSKIEAGQVELTEEEHDVADIVDTAVSLVEEKATRAGVPVRCMVGAGLPKVWVDGLRMRQVVINLLTNAIKYSDPGFAVTLHAACSAQGMEIIVEDRGCGIAEEDLERVMQPFGQARNALVREHEGTGLGLPICKRLIEQHGGTLTLTSRPQVGTRVVVRLPAHRLRPARTSVPLMVGT